MKKCKRALAVLLVALMLFALIAPTASATRTFGWIRNITVNPIGTSHSTVFETQNTLQFTISISAQTVLMNANGVTVAQTPRAPSVQVAPGTRNTVRSLSLTTNSAGQIFSEFGGRV